MDNNVKWVNEKKIERTMKALEKNNMCAYLVNNEEELLNQIDELINEGDLVACGGSMTLFETNVIDYLRNGKYNFLDRYQANISADDMKEIYRKSFYADAYFASTNAVTENGELYNVDGNGNRVAALLFGPRKVIIVAGVNKIVKNVDEAIKRNREISAPTNAKRLNKKTPCTKVGFCMDCKSPEKICREYTLIRSQKDKDRIHVIFINNNIGY